MPRFLAIGEINEIHLNERHMFFTYRAKNAPAPVPYHYCPRQSPPLPHPCTANKSPTPGVLNNGSTASTTKEASVIFGGHSERGKMCKDTRRGKREDCNKGFADGSLKEFPECSAGPSDATNSLGRNVKASPGTECFGPEACVSSACVGWADATPGWDDLMDRTDSTLPFLELDHLDIGSNPDTLGIANSDTSEFVFSPLGDSSHWFAEDLATDSPGSVKPLPTRRPFPPSDVADIAFGEKSTAAPATEGGEYATAGGRSTDHEGKDRAKRFARHRLNAHNVVVELVHKVGTGTDSVERWQPQRTAWGGEGGSCLLDFLGG